jgi:hypothetical protein
MRGSRPLALSLVVALALCATGVCFAAPISATTSRAFLVIGADRVLGLPFFSPNAIQALTGAYALAPNSPTLTLWYTREAVVLDSTWKSFDLGEGRAYVLPESGGEVLALRADRYTLFFEPDTAAGAAGLDDERTKAFIRAFSRKFLSFFENAASDAELSFPAFVDY